MNFVKTALSEYCLKKYSWVFLLFIIIISSVLRFYHLGNLGIIENEDYVVIASKSILNNGIPEFPSGLVYPRAMPYSYLVAMMSKFCGFSEFIIRTPSVIFSVLLVFVVYLLGKELMGSAGGLISAFLMSVSDWQIQVAQTARMYAMFAFFFTLTVYLMYMAFVQNKRRLIPLVILCGVITCLLHTIAGVLVLIFAVFGIVFCKDRNRIYIALALIITLFVHIGYKHFHKYNYNIYYTRVAQNLENNKNYQKVKSEDVAKREEVKRKYINLLIDLKKESRGFILFNLIFFVIFTGGVVYNIKSRKDVCFILCFVLIMASLYFQQIMLSLIVYFAYLYFSKERIKLWFSTPSFSILIIIILSFALWFFYGVFFVLEKGDNLNFMSEIVSPLLNTLFRYPPNFFKVFLFKYLAMGVCVLLAGIVLFYKSSVDKSKIKERFLLLSFLVPLLAISFHPVAMDRMLERYVYFLHPLYILLFTYCILFFIEKINDYSKYFGAYMNIKYLLVIMFIVLISITTNCFYIKNSFAWLNKNYGENKNIKKYGRNYPFFYSDHKWPAEYLKREWKTGDIVIGMDVLPIYAYFPNIDYQISAGYKGDAEGFLAAKSIGTSEELDKILGIHRKFRIWIVLAGSKVYASKYNSKYNAWLTKVVNTLDQHKAQIKFTGKDNLTTVLLIEPKDILWPPFIKK